MNEIEKINFSTKILQLAGETLDESKILTEQEFDSIIDSETLSKKEKYEKMRTHLDVSSLLYCSKLIDKVFKAYFHFLETSEIKLSNSDSNIDR